jgi:hypothetical protein
VPLLEISAEGLFEDVFSLAGRFTPGWAFLAGCSSSASIVSSPASTDATACCKKPHLDAFGVFCDAMAQATCSFQVVSYE